MLRIVSQKALAGAALIALIFALTASPFLFHDVFGGWIEAFESFSKNKPALATGVFVSLAAASVILGPFSSAPTIPFAVAAWGKALALVMLLAGWILGGIAAYALGLWVGEPLVARIVGEKRLEDWLKKVSRHLDFLTLFLFRLAMPAETGYVFGLLKYRFGLYLIITLLAEIPFALLLIYGSTALISARTEIIAIATITWIAVVSLALRLFLRRVR